MALTAGTRLGPYEILSLVGAGGMGEVYKAKDTRLDRTVAIKILPATFAADAQFRERFDREARTISQLDHPHICALYDVGEQDGTSYLVMQYLEGETLAQRLEHGALPLNEALTIAIQIAEALDKSHRVGIVHRDLKPGNIFLTRAGAKLLDFGLAKASGPAIAGAGVSILPTTPPNLTAHGAILGTFQYMAPEQLEGQEADARTDLFAFGAVLHEMLTGRPAFTGKSQASLISAIMTAEPLPITPIQPLAPPVLEHVVQQCLAKDPHDRWQTAGDVMRELKWITNTPLASAIPATPPPQVWTRLPWLAVGVLLVLSAALAAVIVWHREPELGTIRFSFLPPSGGTFGHNIYGRGVSTPAPHFAPSPDGRQLAYVLFTGTGKPQLWMRGIDAVSGQPVPATEDASFPFWSPDSRFVAFFAQGRLKRIDASGGAPQTVCDAPAGEGGTWNRAGEIVFAPDETGGLYRVAASGGVASPVTTLDHALTERSHRWPQFLPDGRHFLYLAMSEQQEGAVYVGSLESTSDRRLVLKPGLRTLYASSGHVLFLREGTLMAQPFDTRAFRLTGEPVALAEDVAYNPGYGSNSGVGRTAFSVSDSGVLVYRTSGAVLGGLGIGSQVAWFDRAGKRLETVGAPAVYSGLRLSPDETKLVVRRLDQPRGLGDLWMFDLARGAIPSRFTFAPDRLNRMPIWSPDARRIVFASGPGPFDLYEKPASSAGDSRVLLKSALNKFPTDWSSDGRFLAYYQADPKTKNDLWILPMSPAGQPTPFLQTPFNEVSARFSPDGKWIAYVSDQGGARDVYVRTFPAGDREWRISVGGGEDPQWRRDGKELFYVAPGRLLMAVAIEAGSGLAAGVPRVLFDSRTPIRTGQDQRYAVAANGQRFLINEMTDTLNVPITVVINWTAGLRR